MAIGVSLLGPFFIYRWIGPEYAERCTYILYFLSMGSILYMANPLFSRFMTGIGNVGVLAIIRIVGTFILLIVTLLLIRPYGIEGVAFACPATYLLVAPYEFWYATKKLDVKKIWFFRKVYMPLLPCNLILLLFLYYVVNKFHPVTYTKIILIVLSSSFIYLICFAIFAMSKDEKYYFVQKVKSKIK
jgi:O-antigen/teichoic acid export membrane protein